MMKNNWIRNLYTFCVLVLLWWLLHLLVNPYIIPSPFKVLGHFTKILYPVLFFNVLASLYRLTVAMVITVILGYTIGVLLGTSKLLDTFVSPIIYALYPLPRIALLPVFMVLFGLGDASKIILIVTIAIFYIMITTRDAILTIPKDYFISAKTLHLTKYQVFYHVVMPYTLPMLFTSMRIVLGSSIAALFFTESYGAKYGIGYFIMDSWSRMNYIDMYSGIVALCLMGVGIFRLIDWASARYSKWH
ncbi:MAG: ABC transporter permease [Cellulosilyticaceae bacterium]